MNGAPETPAAPAKAEAPVKLTRKQKRAVATIMRRRKRRDTRKTIRAARKLGLRGANGIFDGYRGVEKRPTRSDA